MILPTTRSTLAALAAAVLAVGTLTAPAATANDDAPLRVAQREKAAPAQVRARPADADAALMADIAHTLRAEAHADLRARLAGDLAQSLETAKVVKD